MPGLLPHVDPDGLLEYSVVYTDRALNHMSQRFQRVMQDVSATLKQVYGARSAIVVPGSGSFGMEAVARQFATGKKVLVIRNGWFSYRWSQIFEMGAITAETAVLKARTTGAGPQAPFTPAPIDEVVATIRRDTARAGVRAACRDLGRHDAARRLPARRGRCGACARWAVRAGLRGLGRDVGGHGGHGGGRAGQRAAEGLEQHALRRAGDAGRRARASASTARRAAASRWT